MLLFAAPKALDNIAVATHLSVDGTFKSVPSMFEQLQTIHTMVDGVIYLAVFCLMSNKHALSYRHMWEVTIT